MTIYFVGAEDLDFLNIGGCTVSTTGGAFRSGYARCALAVARQSFVNGCTQYWSAPNAFLQSSFWMSAQLYDTSSDFAGSLSTGYLIRWLDASGGARLQVGGNNANPPANLELQTVNAAGTVTTIATSAGVFVQDYEAKLDFQINYAASGSFTMYVGGVEFLTYSGNLTTDGNTQLAGFNLGIALNSDSMRDTSYANWSEIIVADSDTRSMSLQTLPPSGAGAISQWTGDGTGGSVNEITINDSSGITCGASAQEELFTQSGTLAAPFICAVGVSARAMTGSGAPQHLNLAVARSGTTYLSPGKAVGTAFGFSQYIWQSDPSSGANWTSLASLQIGVESET